MAKSFTILDFQTRFPSDSICLDHLMRVRFGEAMDCPKCAKHGRFHRVKKRPLYECAWCGFQVSPMAGTPFERTHTPLAKWFYAMYLFTTSRHGVPAKELQRQLGVTYKTAWRMGHEIRKYMANVDGDPMLGGHVEADETYIGGRPRKRGKKGEYPWRDKKTAVFGMVQRGGDVMTRVVRRATRKSLIPHIKANVAKGSTISTDEYHPYWSLPAEGYRHLMVKHREHEYVNGEAHTNTLDGFWSMLKRAIRGTHVHVSRKHMSKYLGEFEYRYNMRKQPEQMFNRLLASF
ncbi:MAG: IS1595 family transposase [Rhodospirillales bacterium]|nr:IS1595 family transposase [Rhodospirillales bacterium]